VANGELATGETRLRNVGINYLVTTLLVERVKRRNVKGIGSENAHKCTVVEPKKCTRIAWRGLDSGNGDLSADVRKSDVTGRESPGKPAAQTSSMGEREPRRKI